MISVGENQIMERKINDELLKWRRDSLNMPFFLYGPRQVGKTYSVLEFGKKYYKNVVYFNTENNEELISLMEKEKVLSRLVAKLSILSGESIFQDDTLIVFDNCNDEKVINALKVFGNKNNEYQIVLIGNNRLVINKTHVEEFYYRGMYAMDFFEYLSNTDKIQLIDFIKDSVDNNTAMPFHQMALDAYYDFLVTGGFPEVIHAKLNGATDLEIEAIKQKIFDIYRCEYAKHDLFKGDEIMFSLSSQLVKENKKFQYGAIKKGARSKDYENSINNLVSNGMLMRSYRLSDIKSPLQSLKDNESFKLYYNDVGLLYSMLFLNKSKFMTDDNIRRSLIENEVANTLVKLGYTLYYYQSDGKAEINFVIQTRNGKIVPIEVVNMKLTKAKAMSMFMAKYELNECVRLTEDNFSKKKGVRFIPIYAACYLKEL